LVRLLREGGREGGRVGGEGVGEEWEKEGTKIDRAIMDFGPKERRR